MSGLTATLLVGAILCAGLLGAQEFKSLEEAKQAAFKAEEQKLWKKIAWRTDPDKAIAEATQAKKPIMVFVLVNEWGKLEADQC